VVALHPPRGVEDRLAVTRDEVAALPPPRLPMLIEPCFHDRGVNPVWRESNAKSCLGEVHATGSDADYFPHPAPANGV
jgi:hypothetical protein